VTGRHRAEGGRTVAEWTTLAVSSLVLLGVVAAIVIEMATADAPAAPVARVARVVTIGDRHGVRVTVTNEGDETAANVQVTAELTVGGEAPESGDLSIDFLAGGEVQELVFVFDRDPDGGELSVAVTGFEDP